MKLAMLILLLIVSMSLIAQTPQAPSQGSGSLVDPYHISSFNNLLWIGQSSGYWGLHYIQTADIDASPSEELNSGAGWVPLGNASPWFTGSYDGQGYTISGLYFSRGTSLNTGFFGYMVNARLNRIHLRNVNMFGSIYTGGLAGVATGGYINNCSVTGTIRGNSDVGGLVGFGNHNAVITNSYSQASVQGNDNVGGFIGQSGFNNCYIHHSYSTGQVIYGSASYKGGFIGRLSGGTVNYCYWDTQSSGISTDAAANPRLTAQMRSRDNYVLWNFNNRWSINEGMDYPNLDLLAEYSLPLSINLSSLSGSGTESDPYLIETASKLNLIRLSLDSCYKLTADIDLSDTSVWNSGQGWLPIGDALNPFTGNLDGNNKKLLNLTLTRPITDYNGLFAYTQNATIHDLDISGATLMVPNYGGVLAGSAMGGCMNNVKISGIMLAKDYCGGIVGRLTNGSITNSSTDILIRNLQVAYTTNYVGGIAGLLTSSGEISGSITNSFSAGDISSGWQLGGIVGALTWGFVENCYSHVSVNGGRNIGGIVGLAGGSNPAYISNCFATGAVVLTAGGSFAGGIAGYLSDGSSMIHSYWNTQTTGIPNDIGNNGRTTAQMTYPGSLTTFSTWDFDNLWLHDISGQQNFGYPYLAWQETAIPVAVQGLMVSIQDNVCHLEWQAAQGATLYKIYASDDPFAPFEDWTLLNQVAATDFDTGLNGKMFYMVRYSQD